MVNDKGASIIGVTAGFLALSLVAVCLRCYVRLRIVKAFGWDDGIMVGAMVSLFTTRSYAPKSHSTEADRFRCSI
jgi:hypothetical protein